VEVKMCRQSENRRINYLLPTGKGTDGWLLVGWLPCLITRLLLITSLSDPTWLDQMPKERMMPEHAKHA